jgi:uncharacterized MAPEG superfamily protein
MTIPLWVLLGFATWTLLLLTVTVGYYRWSRILTRRATIADFPADATQGADWYRRATRAHANCIENLPVYGAVVVAATAAAVQGPLFDALAVAMLVARVVQSSVHVLLVESQRSVAVRFGFYLTQVACMVAWLPIHSSSSIRTPREPTLPGAPLARGRVSPCRRRSRRAFPGRQRSRHSSSASSTPEVSHSVCAPRCAIASRRW